MSLLPVADPYRPSYHLPLPDDGEVNQSGVDDIYQVDDRQGCLDSLNVTFLEYRQSSLHISTLSWKCLMMIFFPPSTNLVLAQLIISLSTIGVPSVFS